MKRLLYQNRWRTDVWPIFSLNKEKTSRDDRLSSPSPSMSVLSQSWSRPSSTTSEPCVSWRACTGEGCWTTWCWRRLSSTPSSPAWTNCWSSTPASCRSCWRGGARACRTEAPPTSPSAGWEICSCDRYGAPVLWMLLRFRKKILLKRWWWCKRLSLITTGHQSSN